MIEIGRIVVKIAGRDAGKKGVIIDVLDSNYVMLDGETRRRKCNIIHIEPVNQEVKIKKNASHDEVTKVLKEIGIEALQTKPKQKTEKPKAKRKTHEQIIAQKEEKKKLRDILKPKKKEEKKAESKDISLEEKAGSVGGKKEEKPAAKEEKHAKKEPIGRKPAGKKDKPKTEKPKVLKKEGNKK